MATTIIAEVGVNHNGDLDTARRLIDIAASAGANFVKFQTFSAKELATSSAIKAKYQYMNDNNSTQQEMLQQLELSLQDHQLLIQHCNDLNISFLSTAFGVPQLKFLIDLGVSAIKVPSGEITHLPLLESMAKNAYAYKLPVFMSTGMSNLGDVEAALQVFLDHGISRKSITLLHCTSSYPAPLCDINLKSLHTLATAFNCQVGFSDHSLGVTAPVAAVALGATVIEKHITLDRGMLGPDHQASLEPIEFTHMVQSIRDTEQILGDGIKTVQESEINTRDVARRSIRAAKDIAIGTKLTLENLICQRPADGISPMDLPKYLGRNATRSYQIGDPITEF